MIDNTYTYSNLIIYYFSGTGNAKYAAENIIAIAQKNGIKTKLFDISKDKPKHNAIDENTLIGFCFPTHGFNAPPIVLKYISKFPKRNLDVFLLNTRAGMKLFKIHTPGLGGIALWLPAIILFLKGYKIKGFRPLDLPSNWISLHPGLSSKAKNFIVSKCNATLSNFTNRILQGKRILNGFIWLPLDIAVLPISFAYYLYGRYAIAKTFFANYDCNNCGLCIKNCPLNAIKLKNNRPFWTFKCESCMKCMNNCPKRAIETAHGFILFLWWLAFSFLPLLVVKGLVEAELINQDFYKQNFNILFYGSMFLIGIITIYFGYEILHQLLRIRIVNKIITFTSLTHYKFWKRYKMPSA